MSTTAHFTISAIHYFDQLIPNKRCETTGKIITIESEYYSAFPIELDEMPSVKEQVKKAYPNEPVACFVSDRILFVSIRNKVVRVMPYSPLLQRGFSQYAIGGFEKYVRPFVEIQGKTIDLMDDYLGARPFNIAKKSPKLIASIERHHKLADLIFKASRYCIYVIKDDQVVRIFRYEDRDFQPSKRFKMSAHAQQCARKYFSGNIKAQGEGILRWMNREISDASEYKRIYNDTAYIASIHSTYPAIDVQFFTTAEAVFVVDRASNNVVTIRPRDDHRFSVAEHREKEEKLRHSFEIRFGKRKLGGKPMRQATYKRSKNQKPDLRKWA